MDTEICSSHGVKHLVYNHIEKNDLNIETIKSYYICKICMFECKDNIEFYYNNFEHFKNNLKISNKEIESNLEENEGFNVLNKQILNNINNLNIAEEFYMKIFTNKEKIKMKYKDALLNIYNKVIEKYKNTLDTIENEVNSLDLTIISNIAIVNKLENELQNIITLIESEQSFNNEYFVDLINKFSSKLSYMSKNKIIDPDLKISYINGSGNTYFLNGSNVVKSNGVHIGSYWCEKSEETLEGPFTAKFKINNITIKTDWRINIGIIKSNSTKVNNYYTDGLFFMCSGKKTVEYLGNTGISLFPNWENNDIVIIKRDEENNIYFGLNNENELKLAYNNIKGSFKLCIGFSASCNNDSIEFVELDC